MASSSELWELSSNTDAIPRIQDASHLGDQVLKEAIAGGEAESRELVPGVHAMGVCPESECVPRVRPGAHAHSVRLECTPRVPVPRGHVPVVCRFPPPPSSSGPSAVHAAQGWDVATVGSSRGEAPIREPLVLHLEGVV